MATTRGTSSHSQEEAVPALDAAVQPTTETRISATATWVPLRLDLRDSWVAKVLESDAEQDRAEDRRGHAGILELETIHFLPLVE